ncbi:MAG: phage baseplate assembly protein V [Nitrosomonadales bacterium]
MIREVKRHIERALNGIRLGFRGKLTRNNSAYPIQLAQAAGLADELLQNVELMQQYGYTSNPPPDSECIVLPLGGRTGHGIIIATEHGTYRLKNLKPGEVALYSDEGDSIVLKRGRIIEVTTQTFRINATTAIELNAPSITGNATGSVSFNTPTVNASAAIVAQGEISDHGNKSMSNMRMVYNGHTHQDPQGGSVQVPGATM